MKNREKYREQILNGTKEGICNTFIKPIILDKLNLECGKISCEYCWLRQAIWLEEEYEEPKVNWKEVAVDIPILVSQDGKEWHRRHFARYENGKVYVWKDGRTSWSYVDVFSWKYAKLAEEE